MDIIKKMKFTELPKYNFDKMTELMKMDKKAQMNKLIFVLPTDYSKVDIVELSTEELKEINY